MSFFDRFKKEKKAEPQEPKQVPAQEPEQTPKQARPDPSDVYRAIFAQMEKEAPSRHYVAGSVFDYTRKNHDIFARFVRARDARALKSFFSYGYSLLLSNPASLGTIPQIIDRTKDDTEPIRWNADILELPNGDAAALCYMPIRNESLAARIIGIVLSEQGDGYYYCMLNKDETQPSDVMRNKAAAGVAKVGTVTGRGFELMDSFTACIRRDFYGE